MGGLHGSPPKWFPDKYKKNFRHFNYGEQVGIETINSYLDFEFSCEIKRNRANLLRPKNIQNRSHLVHRPKNQQFAGHSGLQAQKPTIAGHSGARTVLKE